MHLFFFWPPPLQHSSSEADTNLQRQRAALWFHTGEKSSHIFKKKNKLKLPRNFQKPHIQSHSYSFWLSSYLLCNSLYTRLPISLSISFIPPLVGDVEAASDVVPC